MSKVLVLDDIVERHEGFRKILAGHEVTHCWTYLQAITAFKTQKYDMACLDHDLGDLGRKVRVKSEHFNLTFYPDSYEGGGMYPGARSYYDGTDVAFWLKENPTYCPSKILIHSHNPTGANSMAVMLKQIPGVEVTVKEYKAP